MLDHLFSAIYTKQGEEGKVFDLGGPKKSNYYSGEESWGGGCQVVRWISQKHAYKTRGNSFYVATSLY